MGGSDSECSFPFMNKVRLSCQVATIMLILISRSHPHRHTTVWLPCAKALGTRRLWSVRVRVRVRVRVQRAVLSCCGGAAAEKDPGSSSMHRVAVMSSHHGRCSQFSVDCVCIAHEFVRSRLHSRLNSRLRPRLRPRLPVPVPVPVPITLYKSKSSMSGMPGTLRAACFFFSSVAFSFRWVSASLAAAFIFLSYARRSFTSATAASTTGCSRGL